MKKHSLRIFLKTALFYQLFGVTTYFINAKLISASVGTDPDALLLRSGNEFIPECRVCHRDQTFRSFPGTATHQIHTAVLGDDVIGQTAGIGDHIAGDQRRINAGNHLSLFVSEG